MTHSEISLIETFNQVHAAIMLGGKFAILTETTNPITDYPEIKFSSVADLKRLYSNQKVMGMDDNGNPKLRNPVDIWMDHPDRRGYKGIVFIPGHEPIGYYNLFRGFAVEPAAGDCSLYLDHVFHNICSANETHYEWLLDWLADAVQNPADRKGTAVVLRGGQGTGKGVFTTNFGKIFGSHFVHVSGQHRLTGKFNNHLSGSLLVYVDEGFWAGDRRDAGTLKAMITEDWMLVEPKFQDAFPLRNHMRVVMASNNNWVIPAGLDERRFFVLDVSDRNQKDTSYFGAVEAQMKDGGVEALMDTLMAREIESNLRTIPRTQALFDQMVPSMSAVQAWWFDCLYQGRITEMDAEWPESVPKETAHNMYVDYCGRFNKRYASDIASFCKELYEICPGAFSARPRKNESRGRHIRFPELGVWRKSFENIVQVGLNWDADDNII